MSLITTMLLCLPTIVDAQESFEVKGVVTAIETDEPLTGATVVIRGSQTGAVTNLKGEYSIKAKSGDALVFSYFSMKSQTINVNKSTINVALEEEVSELEEVVVIGYGSVRKKEATGATAHVRGESLDEYITTDLAAALQGAVAGVSVTASSGDPGSESIIQIRGVTSLSDDDSPLYVIDGVPQEGVPMLNNNEIQSIDILKDAASAAIYGTRGAAGVILVTTKVGEEGKLKISSDATFGLSSVKFDNLPRLMDSSEQTYYQYLYFQSNSSEYEDTIDEFKFPQINSPELMKYDTDHTQYVLGTETALDQRYGLTLSGGSKQLTYSTIFGFSKTEGVIVNSGYTRFNMRTNLTYKGKRSKITQNISYNYDDKESAVGGSISSAMKLKPYYMPVERDMTSYIIPTYESSSSLYSTINTLLKQYTTTNEAQKSVFNYNIGFDFTLIDGLTFSSKASYGITDSQTFKKVPMSSVYNLYEEELGSTTTTNSSYIQNSTSRRTALTAQGGFTYSKIFNKVHSLNATAIISYEQFDYKGFWAKKTGVDTDLEVLDAATLTATVGSDNYYTNKLFGSIARIMYSYDRRYMLSASMRADSSSKFSPDNRWGYFPSISAAWNISDESFFKPIKSVLNNTKLRLSYGTTGNQNVSAYTYQEVAYSNYDYVFDDTTINGSTSTTYPNYDIKWETSTQYNAGLDVGILKNKFTFTADYYYTTKKDMLATVKLPVSAGVGESQSMTQNIGNMLNTGLELSLNYNAKIAKDLSLSVGVNYFKNYNEIVSLGSSDIIYNYSTTVNGDPITVFAPGHEAGAFYLYKSDGVIKTADQLERYQAMSPLAQMGDMMYKDLNNDKVIDENDKTYCGSGFAEFEMGLNFKLKWKRFDFNTQWYASIGNEVLNGLEAMSFDMDRNYQLTQMWTPQNSTSDIPINTGDSDMSYAGCSDVWLEDGSFLKMKLISLGYTLPVKKLNISSMRIFITCQNLLTITRYSGLDPEVGGNGLTTRGVDKGAYPKAQSILAGIKINF